MHVMRLEYLSVAYGTEVIAKQGRHQQLRKFCQLNEVGP
jgi:hypothetical protein